MTDAMRSMLDELMGKERNAKEKQRAQINYDDPEVCKHALAGLCPYSLFKNTKSDLGECEFEIHEDHIEYPRLREQFDALPEDARDRQDYARNLMALLETLVREMDRKIAKAKERVEAENRPRPIKPADQARLDGMKQQEKEALEKSEAMAMDGDADGSMAMTEAAERLREAYTKLHTELVTPERTMSVCEVCGVFINSTDNEQRRLDHINGKQYVGWCRIRGKLDDLRKRFRAAPRDDRERERERPGRDDGRAGGGDGRYPPRGRAPHDADRYGARDRDRERGRYDDRYGGGGGGDRYGGDRYGDRGGDRYGDRHGRGGGGGDRRYGGGDYRRQDRDYRR